MRTPLRGTSIAPGVAPTSALFFGAASVGGRVAPRAAQRALLLALDLGVTGVDLARSYGYGNAERIVGEAIRARRDKVVLCTKAGIDPAPISSWMRHAAPAARIMSRIVGKMGRRLPTTAIPTARERPFDRARFTRSLETSLEALGTDWIDIFLAHRCPSTTTEYDDFAALAESFVERGTIRLWGICGPLTRIAAVSAHAPPPVAQVPAEDAFHLEREPATVLTMFYRPFGGREGFEALLSKAPLDLTRQQKRRWVTEVALRGPLNKASMVPRVMICAMSTPDHVAANVDALQNPRMSSTTLARAYDALHGSRA